MATIKILPDRVINKIAAGEVVERPESVVKELIENSIDAKAKSISIVLKKSGKRNICVKDDGIGMDYDDALLAFERHATSKIEKVEDIESISSLGFRGEALPSIASVSKVTVKTAKRNNKEGTILRLEGGKIKSVQKSALNYGTEICVENLFYNVPARKKFLKSDRTELARIVRLVNSYALANPGISFSLTNDGRMLTKFTEFHTLQKRVRKVLGEGFLHHRKESENIIVEVFLLPPEDALSSPMKQYFLLNGRFIKDKLIGQALFSAFKEATSFFKGYPQGIIKIQIPPEIVDVNVHPSKLEVRFRNEKQVYGLVKETCKLSLEKRNSASSVKFTHNSLKFFTTKNYNLEKIDNKGIELKDVENNYCTKSKVHGGILTGQEKEYKILGQFNLSYIVAEKDNSLYLFDQHVVHERILYEKAFSMIKKNEIPKQPLIIPVNINTDGETILIIKDNENIIRKSGFKIDLQKEGVIKISAYPVFIKQGDIEQTFLELVALIKKGREGELHNLFKDIAATIGCKNAIKANTHLSIYEMESLISELFECENPYYCPHGRPVMVKFELNDIEKVFKRK